MIRITEKITAAEVYECTMHYAFGGKLGPVLAPLLEPAKEYEIVFEGYEDDTVVTLPGDKVLDAISDQLD